MVPAARLQGLGEVKVIAVSAAEEATVAVVVPETLPSAAAMVDVPAATADRVPAESIVAVAVDPDVHVTVPAIIACVVESEYVPIAAICCVDPTMTFGLAGVTAIEDRVAPVTVKVVFPETVPKVAMTVDEPTATADARPAEEIATVAGVPENHVAMAVMSRDVPSE